MAIGSMPEYGTSFREVGSESLRDWLNGGCREWREMVGSDGLGGYATLAYPRVDWVHEDVS